MQFTMALYRKLNLGIQESFRHIETFLSRNKTFSSLASTLKFVLGRDFQLQLEKACLLFSYTPPKKSKLILSAQARCNKMLPIKR